MGLYDLVFGKKRKGTPATEAPAAKPIDEKSAPKPTAVPAAEPVKEPAKAPAVPAAEKSAPKQEAAPAAEPVKEPAKAPAAPTAEKPAPKPEAAPAAEPEKAPAAPAAPAAMDPEAEKAAKYEQGMALYREGKYAEAFPLLKQGKKERDSFEALGWMCSTGNGTQQNDDQAYFYYFRAAKKMGSHQAMRYVIQHTDREGKKAHAMVLEEALKFIRTLSAEGDDSFNHLIPIFEKRIEDHNNRVQAMSEEHKVRMENQKKAFDRGVELYNAKDLPGAVKAFKEAAELGSVVARSNLYIIYANGGEGLPADQTEALKWCKIAAELGNDKCKKALPDAWFCCGVDSYKKSLVPMQFMRLKWPQSWAISPPCAIWVKFICTVLKISLPIKAKPGSGMKRLPKRAMWTPK